MTTTAQQLIALCERCILRHDLDNFKTFFERLPMKEVSNSAFDKLFIRFATAAYQANVPEIGVYLLDEFQSLKDDDFLEYETYVFLLVELDDKVLRWLMDQIQSYSSIVAHVSNLIKYDPSDATVKAVRRVFDIYGQSTLPYVGLHVLIKLAEQYDNGKILDLLTLEKSQILPPLPKPRWIRNADVLKTHDDLMDESFKISENIQKQKVEILDTSSAVELLTSGMSRQGISTMDIETAQGYLETFYNGLTRTQKIQLLNNSEKNKDLYYASQDDTLFRYWGPTNMIAGVDLTQDHECCRFGGCRMLICRCFERYDDDDIENQDVPDLSDEVDWFTDSCQECGNRIAKKWYALRLPLTTGGWRGCYCSWKCVKQQSDNVLQDQLVEINQANIETIGISDRLDIQQGLSIDDQEEQEDDEDVFE